MARSGNSKPMRGNMVGGRDCPCCNSWTGSRVEEKRELHLEASEGANEYFNYRQDESDFHDENEMAYLKEEKENI